MKKIILIIFFFIIIIGGNIVCIAKEQTEEKEGLYSQLNRAVIRLEHSEKIIEKDSNQIININKPDGTAFFIRSENDLFIVTARHVVENDYDLYARVQCKNIITSNNEVILLKLERKRWVFHPQGMSDDTRYVDVAIMKISWIKDREIKAFRYELPNSENSDKNQLPFEDPLPPDNILIFGFPLDIGFELIEQKPLGRLGMISMVVGSKFLKINNKFVEEKAILIDAKMFPGNSGSPVINQPSLLQPKIILLGLVIATNEFMDYGVIEPVSRIRETIEIAKKETIEDINFWFTLN
jgi:hypothetical protein